MGQVEKIFKVVSPIDPSFHTPQRQNPEAVEDYSVKKVIHTQELYANSIAGSITANANALQGFDLTSVTPTDGKILVYRTASSAYVLEPKPTSAGSPTWGTIIGTLGNQTDLTNALNTKVASTNYVNGLATKASSTAFYNHVGSAAIHFTESSIDHTHISNRGTNTHAQLDTHVSSSAIHFTKGSIDHTGIQSIGSNTHAQIDTHIGSAAIHFTKGNISHTQIADIGSNTHTVIDTHIGSAAIHFTKANISHTQIGDIGSNTHATLDTHVGSAAIHFTKGSIDHTGIQSVGTNTHAQLDTHVGSAAIHFTKDSITAVAGPLTISADNSTADQAYVPMVLYNTDATPPTANTFPIGTIYIQYTN